MATGARHHAACAERLSDRQAANAVRSRLDWTQVLRLELTAPGCDASILSECRTRLRAGAAEYLLFDTLLSWCRDRQLSNAGDRQRTDSTYSLAAVRVLKRIEVVGDTQRHALNALAIVTPDWLRTVSPPDWKDRDVRRAEDDRLPATPAARAALALTIGHDGWLLLSAVDHADAPPWLRQHLYDASAPVAHVQPPCRTAYRCRTCEGYDTRLTGTVFENTRQRPATLGLLLRGMAKGEPTARLARELGLSRTQLHTWRQRLQTNLNETAPTDMMTGPALEADELSQNAGENKPPPS